ncbi:HIT family protein [Rhodobium gokarnense]|uniref:Diadenosine tetraphosphate (Ap4A) HIT family hydrolase n=1 Tax=Rhodobium gokarnense TaxID=364296 RepID=A0ABT3HI92_9HYPH|nr:HIT family protein [Rhodobium gokarnense]MCW2310118.1 diadenosine tetraphosphate (Ap4A) HIT family hydrolase [Rhodobium gokarnense]
MTDAFSLHPQLDADSSPIADLGLSTVRLMDDATYPWLLLVPRVPGAVELIDLSRDDRHLLMDEIAAAETALRSVTGCDKLNVGALGNMVPQLHIHVIARFKGDAAWPGPVWGKVPARPYAPDEKSSLIARLTDALAGAGR